MKNNKLHCADDEHEKLVEIEFSSDGITLVGTARAFCTYPPEVKSISNFLFLKALLYMACGIDELFSVVVVNGSQFQQIVAEPIKAVCLLLENEIVFANSANSRLQILKPDDGNSIDDYAGSGDSNGSDGDFTSASFVRVYAVCVGVGRTTHCLWPTPA